MYQRIAKKEEIPEGTGKAFVVGEKRIAVFRVNGEFFAIDDRCTHAEASLSEGEVFGCEVECPRHGARFDLRTGEALSLPAVQPVRRYPVKVEGEDVLVAVE